MFVFEMEFYRSQFFFVLLEIMENMQYAEELVREFLVFRGFTDTLQAFDSELSTDIGKGFQVDKIIDLIFSVYIPRYQADKLVGLFDFFKQCLAPSMDRVYIEALGKLEGSVLRYYIVNAVQSGAKNKAVEFFGMYGNDLFQKDQDWTHWFGKIFTLTFFICFENKVKLVSC